MSTKYSAIQEQDALVQLIALSPGIAPKVKELVRDAYRFRAMEHSVVLVPNQMNPGYVLGLITHSETSTDLAAAVDSLIEAQHAAFREDNKDLIAAYPASHCAINAPCPPCKENSGPCDMPPVLLKHPLNKSAPFLNLKPGQAVTGVAGGRYVISENDVWRPGSYNSPQAAALALTMDDEVLQRLQDRAIAHTAGVISLEDLKEAS